MLWVFRWDMGKLCWGEPYLSHFWEMCVCSFCIYSRYYHFHLFDVHVCIWLLWGWDRTVNTSVLVAVVCEHQMTDWTLLVCVIYFNLCGGLTELAGIRKDSIEKVHRRCADTTLCETDFSVNFGPASWNIMTKCGANPTLGKIEPFCHQKIWPSTVYPFPSTSPSLSLSLPQEMKRNTRTDWNVLDVFLPPLNALKHWNAKKLRPCASVLQVIIS